MNLVAYGRDETGNNDGTVVVRMTEDEFYLLRQFLHQQSIANGDDKIYSASRELHNHLIIMERAYGLKRQVSNAIMRSFTGTKERKAAAHVFYEEGGRLRTFAELRLYIMEQVDLYPKVAYRHLHLVNMAEKGLRHLAEVLAKYNPDRT